MKNILVPHPNEQGYTDIFQSVQSLHSDSDGNLVATVLTVEDHSNPTASSGWQFENGSWF